MRFFGDNMVLLTPKGSERMNDLINMNKDWFHSILEAIEPWSESSVIGHKIVWLDALGYHSPYGIRTASLKLLERWLPWSPLMMLRRCGLILNMPDFKCACLNPVMLDYRKICGLMGRVILFVSQRKPVTKAVMVIAALINLVLELQMQLC